MAASCCVERGELLLCVLQIPPRGVEGLLRRDVLGREILLTMEFAIVIVDIALRLLDLRLHVPVVRLERVEVVAHDPDLRRGAIQREPEREIVEAEQDLALRRPAGCLSTSTSLTMPETSVEMPTLSAST